MSTLIEKLRAQAPISIPGPEAFFKCPEVSNEDLEIVTLALTMCQSGTPKILLNANDWWDLYQVVRKVRLSTIRNRVASNLLLTQLVWLDHTLLVSCAMLGDRSTEGTALAAEEEFETGEDEDAIILAINITLPDGTQVTTQDDFILRRDWHWSGAPANSRWMKSEMCLFEATRNNGWDVEELTFNFHDEEQLTAWKEGIGNILIHLTSQLQAYFDVKVKSEDPEGDGLYLNPNLRFLIGLIEHYRKLGVLFNPELTDDEKVAMGQYLSILEGEADPELDPARSAPQLSPGHEAIFQFFKKQVKFWDFNDFAKKVK